MNTVRPVVLMVLDGWGLREQREDNAIAQANAPNYRRFLQRYAHSALHAEGEHVGLFAGQMGNSNVGHLTIGAGRVRFQDLVRIGRTIQDGSFARNEVIARLKQHRRVHLLGLLSDGGVHSHEAHLWALLEALAGGPEVWVHAFSDGRDVAPKSAGTFLERLDQVMARTGTGRLATLCGRYFAMDRDKRWDRVQQAYQAVVQAQGARVPNWRVALEEAYAAGQTDEFITPRVLGDYAGAAPDDAFFFFDFRADRVRELCHALHDGDFDGFARDQGAFTVYGMAPYEESLPIPTAFDREEPSQTLGEVVAAHGLHQLRLAETEKYAHVTYFLNGGREEPFEGEEREMVPSPKVATYDLKPEMSAPGITEHAERAISSGRFDLIVMNYANADMVGHSGQLAATKAAVEAVDASLGRIEAALQQAGGVALIVADHGNAEIMKDEVTGEPHTAHTADLVPAILVDPRSQLGAVRLADGALADVAPTILQLLGLPVPSAMTGCSILREE